MIGRAWKVYGSFDHRQKASFSKSFEVKTARKNYLKVFNADVTGTNDYTIIYIIGENATECENELIGQISDGIFENCRTGRVEEIPALYLHDLTGDIWTLEEVFEAFHQGKYEGLYETFDEFQEKEENIKEGVDLIELFEEEANRWERIMEISHQLVDGTDAYIIHLFKSNDLSLWEDSSGKMFVWYVGEFSTGAVEIETGKYMDAAEIEKNWC